MGFFRLPGRSCARRGLRVWIAGPTLTAMEFVMGVGAASGVVIVVLLLIAARRSKRRSRLDPSRDLYQGFPEHKAPGHGQHWHNDNQGSGSF